MLWLITVLILCSMPLLPQAKKAQGTQRIPARATTKAPDAKPLNPNSNPSAIIGTLRDNCTTTLPLTLKGMTINAGPMTVALGLDEPVNEIAWQCGTTKKRLASAKAFNAVSTNRQDRNGTVIFTLFFQPPREQPKASSSYRIEVIAKTGDIIDGVTLARHQQPYIPSIDGLGRVYFIADFGPDLNKPIGKAIFRDREQLIKTGEARGDATLQSLDLLRVNSLGAVAYRSKYRSAQCRCVKEGIFKDDQLVLEGQFGPPVINASGEVVAARGDALVSSTRGVIVNTNQMLDGRKLTFPLVPLNLTDAGQLAFHAPYEVILRAPNGNTGRAETVAYFLGDKHIRDEVSNQILDGVTALLNNKGQMLFWGPLGWQTQDAQKLDTACTLVNNFALNNDGVVAYACPFEWKPEVHRLRITPGRVTERMLVTSQQPLLTLLETDKVRLAARVAINDRGQIAFAVSFRGLATKTARRGDWLDTAIILATPNDLKPLPPPKADPECSPCISISKQSKSPNEQVVSLQLCHTLMGVLKELGDYRIQFMNKFGLINLFPTVYFNTTRIELERLEKGEFNYPIEKMQQMVAFYDAYKANRAAWDQGKLPERHWAVHFEGAVDADRQLAKLTAPEEMLKLSSLLNDVLNSGITAHVHYDLARALRFATSKSIHPEVKLESLKVDFLKTVPTLRESATASQSDIQSATYPGINRVSRAMVDAVGSVVAALYDDESNVIRLRNAAWEAAFDGTVLTSYDGISRLTDQPVGDHDALSSKGRSACHVRQN
ncbi:MAG: hypothetical protein K1X67_16145 [Fimbriimonadaceae bacterium]|nr:hypothetical protein [Fimbriimonadaceae bacterium]